MSGEVSAGGDGRREAVPTRLTSGDLRAALGDPW